VTAPRSTLRFTLYSRSWCHLCDDMLAALHAFMARTGVDYAVDVVDVDAEPALVARYDELVPVLVGDDGVELCHYFLDEGAVQRYLVSGAPVQA
jgi:thiol-disulfide isomerase/thioredoxin